jgi:hypothetical protein
MKKQREFWIAVKYPWKPAKIEVRGIRHVDQALKLAQEMHLTRKTAEVSVLGVDLLFTFTRTTRGTKLKGG